MASEGSTTSTSPDSYIGSLISLTSKSEIRYEGVLYSIKTGESSIGLRNVRSFGTEGRKKDGPQVPPSDRVYEYILFRGSDIKDLQVKSTPPVLPSPPIENDPAIIQSHYPRPAITTTSLPPSVSVPLPDVTSQAPQSGHPAPNFQSPQSGHPAPNFQAPLPLYQPGGNMGLWGPTPAPPSANAGGVAVPMYWHGYYGTPNALPQLHQQSLLRPPPGMPMPTSLQQPLPYPAFNASLPPGVSNLQSLSLPDIPRLLSTTSSSTISTSLSLAPSTLPPPPSVVAAPETSSSSTLTKAPISSTPPMTMSSTFPSRSLPTISNIETSSKAPVVSSKGNALPMSTPGYKPAAQTTSTGSSSASSNTEPLAPPLLTPTQLLNSGAKPVSSSQSSQAAQKDVEVVQVSSSPESSVPVPTEVQLPILPLPPASKALNRPSGPPVQARHGYRSRERGRGSGGSRQVTRFTEDFDFITMNEKFKKDEVWGSLGKGNNTKEREGSDLNGSDQEDGEEFPHAEVKPFYKKDDFFDTLSCNTLDQDSRGGRMSFSEQRKLDSETFGEFARFRGGRGGRGYARGGRGRGPNYARGYGYVPRGRGRAVSS